MLNVDGANYVEMASYYINNTSTIATNNAGYGNMTSKSSVTGLTENSDVFELVTSGNYGVKIKIAGQVFVSLNQDIITTGSTSYASNSIRKNGTIMAYQLLTNTNGQWDCIHNAVTMAVSANDVVGFYFGAAGITAMDGSSWAQYNFIWTAK
jgi:hypothetical protein